MKAPRQGRPARRWRALLAALVAATMAQPAAAADAPWCSGVDLDMGGGFRASFFLIEGSPEFFLSYAVPAGAATTSGAILVPSPVQIDFISIDAPANYRFGLAIDYQHLDLREPDGRMLDPDFYRLDCGPGMALTLVTHHDRAHLRPPGPTGGGLLFADGPDHEGSPKAVACFEALQRSGHFRLAMSRNPGDPPALVLEGDWPLAATVEAVRALRARDLERAHLGQCRLRPPPPPPD